MRRYFSILLFPIVLVIAAQGLSHVRDGLVVFDGKFIGLDGYTHLLRAKQFVLTGDWFDHSIHRGNPPDGDVLYWPRPFDAVLLVGAAALTPFLGFDTALHAWGIFVSPVLHLLSLLVLLWAARRLFDDAGLTYLGVLFAFQLFIIHLASIARPDHHSLLMLLFIWFVGAGVRLVAPESTARTALFAGLPAIISMWISLESLVVTGAMFVALGLAWIVVRERFALKTAIFALTLTTGFGLTLLAEHGFKAFDLVVYDAPSVVHLALFAIVSLISVALALCDAFVPAARHSGARLLISLIGAAAVAGAMWFVFPKFFRGPLVDVDPEVVRLWFNDIAEFAPLVDPKNLAGLLPQFIFHLGLVVLAVPFMIIRAIKGDAEERRTWLFLLLLTALYVLLAATQQRWAGFAQYVLVIPYAALLVALLDRINQRTGLARAAGRAGTVILLAFGFPVLGLALTKAEPAATKTAAPGCPLTEMSRWLNKEPALNDRPRRILSFINFGPELLYRTRHEVIATPNHRNGVSILDAVHALGRVAPSEAKTIIDRRGADLVLVCLGTEEANDYRRGNNGNTLFAAIEQGRPPTWLRQTTLPEPLGQSFLLFEVMR